MKLRLSVLVLVLFGAFVPGCRPSPQEVEAADIVEPAVNDELAPMPRLHVRVKAAEKPAHAAKSPAPVASKIPLAQWTLPIIKASDGTKDIVGSVPKQICIDHEGNTVTLLRSDRVDVYRQGNSQPTQRLPIPQVHSVYLAPNASTVIFREHSPDDRFIIHDIAKGTPTKYLRFRDGKDKEGKDGPRFDIHALCFQSSLGQVLVAVKQDDRSTFAELDLKTGLLKRDAKKYDEVTMSHMSHIAPMGPSRALVFFNGLHRDKCPNGLAVAQRDGAIERITGVPSKDLTYYAPSHFSVSAGHKYVSFMTYSAKNLYEVWDWQAKKLIVDQSNDSYTTIQCGFMPNGKYSWRLGISNFEKYYFGGNKHGARERIPNDISVTNLGTGKVVASVAPETTLGQEGELFAISGNGKVVALVNRDRLCLFRYDQLFPGLAPQFNDVP